jgi:hypothetical protein
MGGGAVVPVRGQRSGAYSGMGAARGGGAKEGESGTPIAPIAPIAPREDQGALRNGRVYSDDGRWLASAVSHSVSPSVASWSASEVLQWEAFVAHECKALSHSVDLQKRALADAKRALVLSLLALLAQKYKY